MSMIKISVVIPSYNSLQSLPNTLAALGRQTFPRDQYEVIVVDCSPTSDVADLCASFPGVVVRRETQRFNPGIGRNLGAERAQGALLVFVDSDVVLDPDALVEAWKYYQEGHRIFGGCLELDDQSQADPAAYLEHYFFNHESHRLRRPSERANLSSALMLFDRQLFLSEGGFKDIPRMQDTELTERMRKAGHTLSFTPTVVGYQTQDAPLGKVLRKVYINGKNLYFIRYQDRPLMQKIAFGTTLPALSALKVARIIGRHLRYQDARGKMITVGLTPLLTLAGATWMFGLYRSMLGGKMSDRRD